MQLSKPKSAVDTVIPQGVNRSRKAVLLVILNLLVIYTLRAGLYTNTSLQSCVNSSLSTTTTTATIAKTNTTESTIDKKKEVYGVVGILSSDGGRDKRQAQRDTWVKDSLRDYPLRIYFLLDRETDETLKEHQEHSDMIFLNSTYSGRAVRFGEKLANWYKIALKMHKDAEFVIKMDDDAVVCTHQLWPWLFQRIHRKSYMGWLHGYPHIPLRTAISNEPGVTEQQAYSRMDELFVVLGKDHWKRIAARDYCHNVTQCNKTTQLYDTNYGGTSLRDWLASYDDVHFQPMNGLITHDCKTYYNDETCPPIMACPHLLIVHPVKDPKSMREAYLYNSTKSRPSSS